MKSEFYVKKVNDVSLRRVYDKTKCQYISWEFYCKYTKLEPPFPTLGLIVSLRTYHRFLPQENRREKWCEVVLRETEYSLSLDNISSLENKVKEAERIFDDHFNLRSLPAGRTLWVGGTPITKKDATASFNCSAATINSLSIFDQGFYLLLVGAGFGFSAENKYVSKIRPLYTNKTIVHRPYKGWLKDLEHTEIYVSYDPKQICKSSLSFNNKSHELSDNDFINTYLAGTPQKILIVVGDSKEGWVLALKSYLAALANPHITNIEFEYNFIRPEGTRLKTFGGRASGYGALMKLFQTIEIVVNEGDIGQDKSVKLNSLQVLDIANNIGLAVVVGGVRRSSEWCGADKDDTLILNAKKNLWSDDSLASKRESRSMSNNSLVLYTNPGLEWFTQAMSTVKTSGEPAFVNLNRANKNDPTGTRKVFNPCVEILLNSLGVCNLTEVYLNKHLRVHPVSNKVVINWESLLNSLEIATRIGTRITLIEMFHKDWDKVQKDDRLEGVSLSGQVEFFESLGYTEEEEEEFYSIVRDIIHTISDTYHDELGIPRALLSTTTKPSGTLSTVVGCGSGLHRVYAPYYIRRVRVSSSDPIANALIEMNVPYSPENGQEDRDNPDTWVFSFAVKGDTSIKSIDEPALVQLERYKRCLEYYVDHNVSFTCSVAEDEWDAVAQWLYDNFDSWIGISFMPKFDSTNSPYPQLPYEACDVVKYDELNKKLPQLTENQLIELIAKYEKTDDLYDLIDADCAKGTCPVR